MHCRMSTWLLYFIRPHWTRVRSGHHCARVPYLSPLLTYSEAAAAPHICTLCALAGLPEVAPLVTLQPFVRVDQDTHLCQGHVGAFLWGVYIDCKTNKTT